MSTGNYFKLCGDGLGRVGDCYTFNSEAERLAAFAAVQMARALVPTPSMKRVRIVIWKPNANHRDIRVVGDVPMEAWEIDRMNRKLDGEDS